MEAALLAEDFTDQQLRDQDAAALAADTASTEQQRRPCAVQHRAAIDTARGTVQALRRSPAAMLSPAREAKKAAASKRTALRAQREHGQQGQNRGGGVR